MMGVARHGVGEGGDEGWGKGRGSWGEGERQERPSSGGMLGLYKPISFTSWFIVPDLIRRNGQISCS